MHIKMLENCQDGC